MKNLFLSLFLAVFAVSAQAQPAAGFELLQNNDLSGFSMRGIQQVPTAWGCQGYTNPVQSRNRACTFSPSERLSIYSIKAGCCSVNARLASPANPQWNQTFAVPVAGSYELTLIVTKTASPGATVTENASQAAVIKLGSTPVITVPHADLPVGVPTPVRATVWLPAGYSTVWLGTAVRISNVAPAGTAGYRYDFNPMISLAYLGY